MANKITPTSEEELRERLRHTKVTAYAQGRPFNVNLSTVIQNEDIDAIMSLLTSEVEKVKKESYDDGYRHGLTDWSWSTAKAIKLVRTDEVEQMYKAYEVAISADVDFDPTIYKVQRLEELSKLQEEQK